MSAAPLPHTSGLTPRWKTDFLMLAMIWGASFLFMRTAAVEFGAVLTAAMRVSIAALFLLPLLYFKGQSQVLWANWKRVFFVGVFNSALPFVLYSFAVQHITTGLSSIMNATVPLFGALLAWAWLGDKPGLPRTLGLFLGFLGVLLLAGSEADFKPNAAGVAPLWAVGGCLLATFSYALSANFAKRFIAHVPPLATATGSQCGASLALALPAVFSLPDIAPSPTAWGALLVVGVLCTGVAYILYFRLIENAGPSKALTVTFLIPVFAIGYGVVLLNEHITAWMLMCGAIILIGTGLSSGLLRWPAQKVTP
jgi:drug/metabolite transporter (DMT)-like permease